MMTKPMLTAIALLLTLIIGLVAALGLVMWKNRGLQSDNQELTDAIAQYDVNLQQAQSELRIAQAEADRMDKMLFEREVQTKRLQDQLHDKQAKIAGLLAQNQDFAECRDTALPGDVLDELRQPAGNYPDESTEAVSADRAVAGLPTYSF